MLCGILREGSDVSLSSGPGPDPPDARRLRERDPGLARLWTATTARGHPAAVQPGQTTPDWIDARLAADGPDAFLASAAAARGHRRLPCRRHPRAGRARPVGESIPKITEFKVGLGDDALAVRPIALEDLLNRPQTALDREG